MICCSANMISEQEQGLEGKFDRHLKHLLVWVWTRARAHSGTNRFRCYQMTELHLRLHSGRFQFVCWSRLMCVSRQVQARWVSQSIGNSLHIPTGSLHVAVIHVWCKPGSCWTMKSQLTVAVSTARNEQASPDQGWVLASRKFHIQGLVIVSLTLACHGRPVIEGYLEGSAPPWWAIDALLRRLHRIRRESPFPSLMFEVR